MNNKLSLVLAAILILGLLAWTVIPQTVTAKSSRCDAVPGGDCIIQSENIEKMKIDDARITFNLGGGNGGGGGTVDQQARDDIVTLKNNVSVLTEENNELKETLNETQTDLTLVEELNALQSETLNNLTADIALLKQNAITGISVINGSVVTEPPVNDTNGEVPTNDTNGEIPTNDTNGEIPTNDTDTGGNETDTEGNITNATSTFDPFGFLTKISG